MMWDGEHLIEKGLGTYVPAFDVEGRAKGAYFIPYPTQCPKNCPGNHSAAERKELGPAIVGGKVRRTN